MFDDFEFAEVDDTAPAVTGGGGGAASALSSPGDGGGGSVANIPVLYDDDDDDDDDDDEGEDDDSDAWLDAISLEDIRDLVNWTEDLIHEAVITSPPEFVHRASSTAAPTPAFLSEAVARGFEEMGDEAVEELPALDGSPAPQAGASGEEAQPSAASESSSPTKAVPEAASSSPTTSFVKRLQLLLSRNATAKSAFAPRRFRRAEGEEEDDDDEEEEDDNDLECFEECPPSDHPNDDYSDDEYVSRRVRSHLESSAVLDPEKSLSKPSVRIAVESRWESSAVSTKRDRSPADGPAPRNAVPRERSPPRDQ